MVDPTGTSGAVQQSDLMLATQGGPRFMARLEQLGDATDKHEQAFAKLEIGQSAVAAFNQAQHELASAAASRKLAEAERSQAAKTLAEAQANAKADAKAAAKAQAVEADKIVAMQRQVEKHLKQAEAREQAATEAIARAERAEAEANRVRGILQGKTDYLLTSMREIAQGQ
jgi:protein-tyrosine-phosphatase